MSSEIIAQLDRNIAQSKEIVAFHAALERLKANRDFQKVILKGYFQDEAIRLVHLRGDPNMQKPESQQAIMNQIDAIAALSSYFHVMAFNASTALKAISADEETLTELAGEGNV